MGGLTMGVNGISGPAPGEAVDQIEADKFISFLSTIG